MEKTDKIIFGDNQFFGINHMSLEKAQQLSEKFFDIKNIFMIYDQAFELGLKAIMLNSNDRAKEICEFFRKNESRYSFVNWYPSIPYPHKYANMISEKGIFRTINEILIQNSTFSDIINVIGKGGDSLLTKNAIKLMQMLIDLEMKMFRGLNYKVIFLQNIVVDLILGFNIKSVFEDYCNYIRIKYKALPGLITQNMPLLKKKLEEWGIKEVVICSSFNKLGYLMSPDVDSYIVAAENNNPSYYQLMAMSTLASGAIPAKEAYEFINMQQIQSIVFGASSKNHIKETIKLISI